MRIICGDALAKLRTLEANSFDGAFCDPPYGLSSTEKRSPRRATPRASSRAKAAGFMGMEWDARVPGPEVWAEVLRVLKPGAPLLAFGGTRTFHRLACAIEDAGFILTDTLCWLHGQGFPKGKSQLKPAWEPITLAWKKGKRALNIEGARIPASEDGRWPANVLLDDVSSAALDRQSGALKSGPNPSRRLLPKTRNVLGRFEGQPECVAHRGADSGGASRFFYCPKASQSERAGGTHPTVKPLKLCQYLATLILPPERDTPRRLLVPFAGSGSEMLGARRAGWDDVVGIEREPTYVAHARRRLLRSAAPLRAHAAG